MRVGEWMTPEPVTIGPQDNLREAANQMQRGGFRRLPVVDDGGQLVAILSERDLREHSGYLDNTRVTAVMVEVPRTTNPDAPIEEAVRLLLEHKIGGLPVVNAAGILVGIITETDLLRGLLRAVGGNEHGSARIDFRFQRKDHTFADAFSRVEAAGGVILGLGTVRTETKEDERTFFLRVLTGNPEGLADALRSGGFTIEAVHERTN